MFFIKHIGKSATIYHNLPRRMNTIEVRLAKQEDAHIIAILGIITFKETFFHLFRYHKDFINYYNLTF